MSTRSLNGLSNNIIYVNTINAGDAINVSSTSSTTSTIAVDISKQSATTTVEDTDLFLIEEADGTIKKITGAHMKSELEQSTVVEPLFLSGNAISIKGLSGFTANKFLKVNSGGTAIEYADDNNTEYTAGTNLTLSGSNQFSLNTTLTGNITFDSTAIFNNLIEVKSSSSGGTIRFFELASNGSDKILLKAPDLLGQDFTITLPASTGTICLDTGSTNINTLGTITTGTWNAIRLGKDYIPADTVYNADITSFITASSTTTFTNKTFNDLTTFNDGLAVKFDAFSNVSGFLRLYDDDASNFIDVHPEGHTVSSNISVFIPNSKDNTVLVGKDTTDILSNKSFDDATTFNEGLYTKTVSNSSSSGYVRFYYNNSTDYLDLHGPASGTSARHVIIPATSGTLLTDVDDIPVDKGGTNITSYTAGDLLYATGSATLAKLGIGSANTFLTTNSGGTAPTWSAGYSFTGPLSNSGNAIKIEGLNGFGTAKQIIVSSGTALTYSSTLDSVNLVGCTGNISQFTNNGNYITTSSLTTSVNFATSAGASVSLGNNTQTLNLLGSTIQLNHLKPIQISLSGAGNNLIHYDTGISAGGGMVFGSKNYDSGVYGDDKIFIQTSNTGYKIELDVSYGGILYTAPDHVFAGNLSTTGTITCGGDVTITGDNIKVKQDSKLVNATNTECFLKFYNTVLENTFHRTDIVKLRIAKNTSYAAGTENGYIELIENGTTSNTTRLYFNTAGTAYIFYNGTNLINTPAFAPSDKRVKKNESLADTTKLANSFDNIEIYKYQYEEQYALDKGADPNKYVYGFIAQEVKEHTEIDSQFSSTGDGESIYPNEKIDYQGEKLKVDDLITINKTDMNLLLWSKVKEQDKLINEMKVTIDKLNTANSFKDFKNK